MTGNDMLLAFYRQRRLRRKGESSAIPAGYRQVEYLYSQVNWTGYRWISTGLVADIDCTYEIVCSSILSSGNNTQPVIGDGKTKTDSSFGIWMGYKPGIGVSASFGQGASPYETGYNKSIDATAKHTYKAVLSTAQLYCDGELCGTAAPGTYPHAVNLVLFGQWRDSSSTIRPFSCFTGSVYSFCAYRNGTMIRNMVPVVRTVDSKPGMYDLCGSICPLTNTPFYVNADPGSSNDFTWGELP